MNREYPSLAPETRAGNDLRPIKSGRIKTQLTQERFAEQFSIDVRTLRRYETGELEPPDELMLAVAENVGDPLLMYQHFKQKYRLPDEIVPEVEAVPLTQAVVALLHELEKLETGRVASKLLELAADGIIDPAERSSFEVIMRALDGVRRAVEQLRYARR